MNEAIPPGSGASTPSADAAAEAPAAIITAGQTARILAFCMIGVAVNVTTTFLVTFPIVLEPIQTALGESRTAVMSGHSICLISLALAGPFVGRLVDRYGQGRVLMAGIPLLALALTNFFWLPMTLPLFLLQCGMLGVAGAASYQFIYLSLVPLWFRARLGLALGVAGLGTAIGFMIFPPLTEYLTRTYDWQTAYLVIGLTSLAVALPNMLLYKRPAASVGAGSKDVRGHEAVQGFTAAQALRSSAFWRLASSYLLLCVMLNGILLHFMAMMTSRGLETSTIATIMGIGGLGVLAGRLGCGFLLLRFNGARVGAVIFAFASVGAAVLITADNIVAVAFGHMMLSLALGSETELLNFMAFRTFGERAQGTILGLLTAAYMAGTMIGPITMSIWFDQMGSYGYGHAILVLAGLISAALHWSVAKAASTDAKMPAR